MDYWQRNPVVKRPANQLDSMEISSLQAVALSQSSNSNFGYSPQPSSPSSSSSSSSAYFKPGSGYQSKSSARPWKLYLLIFLVLIITAAVVLVILHFTNVVDVKAIVSPSSSAEAATSSPAAPQIKQCPPYSGSPAAPTARYTPVYTLPSQVQFNAANNLVELTAAARTRIAYATNVPPTSITIADTGSTTGNKAALQAAIDAAFAGTGPRRILLKPGVEYGYGIDMNKVNNAGASAWVYIESETVSSGSLRAEGQRVGLDDASLMPKFGCVVYNVAVFVLGMNTQRVRFTGLHFRTDPSAINSLAAGPYGFPGTGAGYTFTYQGFIGYDLFGINPTTPRPQDIIVDRCIMQGEDNIRYRRLFLANFQRFVVRDSYLENAGDPGNGDSQVIAVLSSPGDNIFINNALYCANGEHILFGGSNSGAPGQVAEDIVVLENFFGFHSRWGPKAQNRLHKNMFELKWGVRVLFERNIIQDYYGYGRLGSQFFAYVLKTSDQGKKKNGNSEILALSSLYLT